MNQYKAFQEFLESKRSMSIKEQVYWATWEEFEYMDDLLRKERSRLIDGLNAEYADKNKYYKRTKLQIIERKIGIVSTLIDKNKHEQLQFIANSVQENQKVETRA